MYCERYGVFSKNFVLHFTNLNSYFSSISNSYIENNPEGQDFGAWPKHGYFNFSEGGLLCVGN
jgi:hypothetical protein